MHIDRVQPVSELAACFGVALLPAHAVPPALDAKAINIMGLPLANAAGGGGVAATPHTIADLRNKVNTICWWPLQGLLPRGTAITPI